MPLSALTENLWGSSLTPCCAQFECYNRFAICVQGKYHRVTSFDLLRTQLEHDNGSSISVRLASCLRHRSSPCIF